ncbi:MAG: MraY family glycosyltransferase [Candidatus Omnitrophica bacterium]|nr:MraY family glycosyltransferase [Candidatus Omnitrophota bacterium]
MLKYWVIFTAALTFGIVFTSLLAKLSLKYRIFRVKDIPLVGGLGMGLAFVFSLSLGLYAFDLSVSRILAVSSAGLFMLFLGIVDDLRELSVAQKFLGQAICAVLLISFGVRTDIMYLGFWPNAAISFLWILGITNAFNLLDIMDGLAAGTALIVSSAFLAMGFLSADPNVQVLSLILCAASLGSLFLIFLRPESIWATRCFCCLNDALCVCKQYFCPAWPGDDSWIADHRYRVTDYF